MAAGTTTSAGFDRGFGIMHPRVQVVDTSAAPQLGRTAQHQRDRSVLAEAQAALVMLGQLEGMDVWCMSRMTEDTWTGLVMQPTRRALAPDSAYQASMIRTYQPGGPLNVDMTLDHHLLVGDRPIAVSDLSRSTVPGIAELGAGWGVGAYVGIALLDARGDRMGSLCALSVEPATHDESYWSVLLISQANAIQAAMSASIDRLGAARAEALEAVRWSADNAARVPDRRGWAALLSAEEGISAPLGDPVGLALVDLGVVRTVRSLRRATGLVAEAAGDATVCRVGPRQLGILLGGHGTGAVGRTAHRVQAGLEAAGYGAATAHTMRAGLESLSETWLRAENALIQARRERALRRDR